MIHRTRIVLAGALAAVLLAPAPALASAAPPDSGAPFTMAREQGHALDCTGERNGVHVAVQLYENSAFGAHASMAVQTADAEYVGGGETEAGLFHDGTVWHRLVVEPQDETAGAAQTAVVSGSYAPAGPRRRVDEVHEEPMGPVVVKGWNTPLAAAVTVRVLGQEVDLTCGDAFAFDLRVWRFDSTGS
ncbi:hypothetical protein [Allostreptomyces psammosilenae]|uniref:Secreted protein n=1 Tax=Allostreptomyces psammosilenae TaxID=1892865 RepID=A0A852ZSL1_9ACTN|nr:hypothetical protein [Allostreptomyces psammosilenae]NYI04815.1 hypothetical protein [Allostreptomyces psammosilenae]